MALADKFKGLDKHKITVAEAPSTGSGQAFNHDRAFDYLRQVWVEIVEAAPGNDVLPWSSENRPDLRSALSTVETEVSAAFQAEDRKRVFEAIEAYKVAYMEIFRAYEKKRDDDEKIMDEVKEPVQGEML